MSRFNQVNKILKLMRVEKSYTQKQLADKARISELFLIQVELGLAFLTAETADEILQVLKPDVQTHQYLKWHYKPLREILCVDDMLIKTYGIQVVGKTLTGKTVVDVIHDVSTDFTAAHNMSKLFTKSQLHPVHFKDVVQDSL